MIRQIASLPSANLVWQRHEKLENKTFSQTQQTMQEALLQTGRLDDPQYRKLRKRYLEWLVTCVVEEESTPETKPAFGQI